MSTATPKKSRKKRTAKSLVLRQKNDDGTTTIYRLRNRSLGKNVTTIPWSHFVCAVPGEVIILRKMHYDNDDTVAESFELELCTYGSDPTVSAQTMHVEEIGVPGARGKTLTEISKYFGWPIAESIRHSRFIR